jgi:hypothetical protein
MVMRQLPMALHARRSLISNAVRRCATAFRFPADVTINGMVRPVLRRHHAAVKAKEVAMSQRNIPLPATVFGIDIGKNIFHVVGLNSDGVPVQRVRFRRDTLLQFFERAAPAVVGMESCAGSQWVGRKI